MTASQLIKELARLAPDTKVIIRYERLVPTFTAEFDGENLETEEKSKSVKEDKETDRLITERGRAVICS